MTGWTVKMNKKWLGMEPTKENYNIRRLVRPSRTGDGSSPIILRLNLRFLAGLMNWPQGWANPNSPVETSKFERWVTESSQVVRLTLSSYCSGKLSGTFQPDTNHPEDVMALMF